MVSLYERKKGGYRVNITTQKMIITIEGMTCVNCENKIEEKLKETKGIQSATASYNTGKANVVFDNEQIQKQEIIEVIERLGYQVVEAPITRKENNGKGSKGFLHNISQIIGVLVILLAVSILWKQFGLSGIFNAFPQVEENMGYGMLFLIGLLTSVHCIGMCGGIHLSQCLSYQEKHREMISKGDPISKKNNEIWNILYPSFLYNAGRVLSYTVIGGIVGALGSVVSFSGAGKGIVQLFAGVFMIIMGINMLNLFPWLRKFNLRMPKLFARKINQKKQNNRPFYIGVLNGLMPCGPLQAMQLYALSTESPIKGAFAMFLFSMGTVPLMFGFGALSSLLSQKFTKRVMKIGAVLVVILGISMFQNGWTLSGFPVLTIADTKKEQSQEAQIEEGVQTIETTLSPYRYEPITVRVGIPVRWTITAESGSLNGCNSAIVIPEYEIQKSLQIGENIIEFTPTKAGTYSYTCWMGMIRSSINVLEEGQEAPEVTEDTTESQNEVEDILQGSGERKPANYQIPVDNIAVAKIEGDIQKVEITLGEEQFEPAVIVLQRGFETEWTIKTDEIKEGRDALLFPYYDTTYPLEEGENLIVVYPDEDFDFATEDNKIFGYVKVVDDIYNFDLNEIKEEVSNYQTYTWE